jgi:hypothetical protein
MRANAGIHAFLRSSQKTWMAGTSPAMTWMEGACSMAGGAAALAAIPAIAAALDEARRTDGVVAIAAAPDSNSFSEAPTCPSV